VPSFRVELAVGAVAAGVDPRTVLPLAAEAASALTVVEAFDVGVVAGEARLIVRFAEDDADVARQIGEHVASTVAAVARVDSYRITQRVGNRWSSPL